MDIDEVIKMNPTIFNDYPIFEIKYNRDGSKKNIYSLASERDIKETQIKSDENELDYMYSQNKISKEDYENAKQELLDKLDNMNFVYNELIFDVIANEELPDLQKEIRDANLNDIDLKEQNLSEWNRKYSIIANSYAKTRELESFILSLIE